MSRPSKIIVEPSALLHNLAQIRRYAPAKKVIAMVKANAYGCGIKTVAPVLDGQVDALGVACIEEALALRSIGINSPCILFQGVFSPDELNVASEYNFSCVIHTPEQLQWLVNTPLKSPIHIWIKVNTGMHRLGFKPHEVNEVLTALKNCKWIHQDFSLLTHMACADEPERVETARQISLFEGIDNKQFKIRSMANSATIIAFPEAHADAVRPGIMLYGVSPFANQIASDFGLIPVMRFRSAVTAIHQNFAHAPVGYGGTWKSEQATVIGVISVGYGDGYPRHIKNNTPVWIKGREVPIVGRVSMDMITVDLTAHPDIKVGDLVELWGTHIPVERIAKSAGTTGYELLCQITDRVRQS